MLGDIRLLLIFCGLLTGATLATVTGFGMSVGSLVFLSVISPALGVQLTTEERQWVLSTGAFAGYLALAYADRKHIPWRWLLYLFLPSLCSTPVGVRCPVSDPVVRMMSGCNSLSRLRLMRRC